MRILSAKCQELLLLSRSQSETIEDLERQLANQTAAPQVFDPRLLCGCTRALRPRRSTQSASWILYRCAI